jgi:hypothetical protein
MQKLVLVTNSASIIIAGGAQNGTVLRLVLSDRLQMRIIASVQENDSVGP